MIINVGSMLEVQTCCKRKNYYAVSTCTLMVNKHVRRRGPKIPMFIIISQNILPEVYMYAPSKHEMLTRFCFDVESTSKTVGQHQNNTRSTFRVRYHLSTWADNVRLTRKTLRCRKITGAHILCVWFCKPILPLTNRRIVQPVTWRDRPITAVIKLLYKLVDLE